MPSIEDQAQELRRSKQSDRPTGLQPKAGASFSSSKGVLPTKVSDNLAKNRLSKGFPKSSTPGQPKGITQRPKSQPSIPNASPVNQANALNRSKQQDRPTDLQQRTEAQLASYGDQFEQKALASADSLKSSIDVIKNGLSKEQALEYGERLGAALEKKINEGSGKAMLVALVLAVLLDASDILLLPLDAFIITIFIKFGIKTILWAAVILIIRKQISFFKRGVFKIIIRLIIVPLVIEPIEFINFVPTYSLLMLDVIFKNKKDKKKAIIQKSELDTTLQQINKKPIGIKKFSK